MKIVMKIFLKCRRKPTEWPSLVLSCREWVEGWSHSFRINLRTMIFKWLHQAFLWVKHSNSSSQVVISVVVKFFPQSIRKLWSKVYNISYIRKLWWRKMGKSFQNFYRIWWLWRRRINHQSWRKVNAVAIFLKGNHEHVF